MGLHILIMINDAGTPSGIRLQNSNFMCTSPEWVDHHWP
jgi:hypothetical protein